MRYPPLKILACAAMLAPGLSMAADSAVAIDQHFRAADMAPQLIKVVNEGKQVSGLKRLAITGFDVEFVTKGSASASATDIGKRGTARTTMTVTLGGVGDAEFQSIVDKLYTDFTAQLATAGFELVPTSQILASPSYRKLTSGGGPSPYKKDGGGEWSTVVAPEGRPVHGFSTQSKGGSPLAALSAMSSVASIIGATPDLLKELDATLVNVRMVVRFVDLASSSSSFLNRISGSAEVNGKVNPTISADGTTLTLQNAYSGARLELARPLQVDAAAIPEIKDTTSAATNVGLAVLSLAMGTGSSSSVSEKQATADPAQYRQLVGDALQQVGSMMIEQMKGLR